MKKFLAVMLSVAMCVSLVACGNGGSSENGSSESQTSQQSTAEGQDASSTQDGQSSSEGQDSQGTTDSVLTVGTNAEFPPFEFVGDDGEPDGFDMALIKAIGEKLGMEVKIENMEFDALISAIGSKIDLAIAGMTVMEDRKDSVDFSEPYYDAIQYVIVNADSEIAKAYAENTVSVADLENKKIGVQLGTTGDFKVEEIAGATATQYNKGVDAVNDLINGRVDAVIIDKNPALVFVDKFSDKLVAIDGSEFDFEVEKYAIAFPKGSELLEKVNQALADIKADGTFDELVKQYIEVTE